MPFTLRTNQSGYITVPTGLVPYRYTCMCACICTHPHPRVFLYPSERKSESVLAQISVGIDWLSPSEAGSCSALSAETPAISLLSPCRRHPTSTGVLRRRFREGLFDGISLGESRYRRYCRMDICDGTDNT